jgi:hypothetical protein
VFGFDQKGAARRPFCLCKELTAEPRFQALQLACS